MKKLSLPDVVDLFLTLENCLEHLVDQEVLKGLHGDLAKHKKDVLKERIKPTIGASAADSLIKFMRQSDFRDDGSYETDGLSIQDLLKHLPPFSDLYYTIKLCRKSIKVIPKKVKDKVECSIFCDLERVASVLEATSGRVNRNEFLEVGAYLLLRQTAMLWSVIVGWVEVGWRCHPDFSEIKR